jgi:hypothetical protein
MSELRRGLYGSASSGLMLAVGFMLAIPDEEFFKNLRMANATRKVDIQVRVGTEVREFTREEFLARLGFEVNDAE